MQEASPSSINNHPGHQNHHHHHKNLNLNAENSHNNRHHSSRTQSPCPSPTTKKPRLDIEPISRTTATPPTNGFLYYPDSNSNDSGFKSNEFRKPDPSSSTYHKFVFQNETEPYTTSPSSSFPIYNNSSLSYSIKSSSSPEQSLLLSPSTPATEDSPSIIDEPVVEPIDWGSDDSDEDDDENNDHDVVDSSSSRTSQSQLQQLPPSSSVVQYHQQRHQSKSKSPPDYSQLSSSPSSKLSATASSPSIPEIHAQQSDPKSLLLDPLGLLYDNDQSSPPPRPPTPEPIQLREVEPWEVERLHNEKIECLNGNFDPEGEFREWHETYTVQTYGDENLLILPYTVIDF